MIPEVAMLRSHGFEFARRHICDYGNGVPLYTVYSVHEALYLRGNIACWIYEIAPCAPEQIRQKYLALNKANAEAAIGEAKVQKVLEVCA
jgi:hypothetical protein